MIVQIDVNPETAALIIEAQSRGVSVDTLIREALCRQGDEQTNGSSLLTLDEWERELQDLIDNSPFSEAPPLSNNAFDR